MVLRDESELFHHDELDDFENFWKRNLFTFFLFH